MQIIMIQIGRKFTVKNDSYDIQYTTGDILRRNGIERVVIEWNIKGGYSRTTYLKKDVEYYLRTKTWIYVKNFNDYLKLL